MAQPTLGNLIVNMIAEKYDLQLMTVDAAAMTEDIDKLIAEHSNENK